MEDIGTEARTALRVAGYALSLGCFTAIALAQLRWDVSGLARVIGVVHFAAGVTVMAREATEQGRETMRDLHRPKRPLAGISFNLLMALAYVWLLPLIRKGVLS